MQLFKTLSIAGKLRSGFGVMLILLIVLALFAYSRLQLVQASSHQLSSNWLPSIEAVAGFSQKASEFRVHTLLSVYADGATQRTESMKARSLSLLETQAQQATYVKLISSAAEQASYETFQLAWTQYVSLGDRMLDLASKDDVQGAQLLEPQVKEAYFASRKNLDQLTAINHAGANEAALGSDAVYRSAVIWLIGISLAAAMVAVLLTLAIVRAIAQPLAKALQAADRIAVGDLSERIEFHGQDEVARLLESMQRMQQSLATTVHNVRSGAESVATASAEIAQGNSDLSSRTEQQASSLEQTSATMEQLNATVRQNADNAAQANQLAQSATQVARDGGTVVGEVVQTMRGIETSSKRIADIINVIDGIAFQTNILALNAAVEAARAGEQGRGFAVVASEVRSLAQRSAEAAKEIKSLINDSVERVQSGTLLVDRAGQTIDNIVTSVQKLADIVGEISSASREQSSGISQVGEAVTQLDHATQQNAALVEESAAASESLRSQAQQLVGAVAGFKLDGQSHAPTQVQRSTAAHPSSTALRRQPFQPKPATKPPASKASNRAADDDWASF
jgi:methyl-accepting chemotaxis protein